MIEEIVCVVLNGSVPSFTFVEWAAAVKRADVLLKRDNGHEFVHILKTRCQHCGRSPRQRGKCPSWPQTLVNRILFVLMNKEQELAPLPAREGDPT